MSIRGIDGQMLVNRTTDYVRDVNAQLRQSQVSQDYLAYQNKILSDLQKKQVSQLEGKETAQIRTDHQGHNREQKKNGKKKRHSAQPLPIENAFVPDDPTVGVSLPKILDIEV